MNLSFIQQVGPVNWALRYSRRQFDKRILHRDSSIRLPTGLKMVLPRNNPHATEIFVTNADVDHGSEALFARFASSEGDFLDIGANAGYYSMYLAPLVRRVYAFEPDARNLAALTTNAITARNLQISTKAVDARSARGWLDVGATNAVSHLATVPNPSCIQVETTSVDDFVRSLSAPKIDLIKTDIEGRDLQALVGARETVAVHQPLILSEIGVDHELANIALDWNYRAYALIRENPSSRPKLVSIDIAEPRYHTKMLFLVPTRLLTAFESLKSKS